MDLRGKYRDSNDFTDGRKLVTILFFELFSFERLVGYFLLAEDVALLIDHIFSEHEYEEGVGNKE